MAAVVQEVIFADFGEPWEETLNLSAPPLAPEDIFRQLEYILDYVEVKLGCQSVAIEKHYIDRDHMEDHGVFYSRSFIQFPNYCSRVHFFSEPTDAVKNHFRNARRTSPVDPFDEQFLQRSYLGFIVIRPLPGAPVGKTVLRPQVGQGSFFPSTRRYDVHLLDVTLHVVGLAFQQQDLAVSACATAALWSSLQKARDLEEFRTASPALITRTAASSLLSHGRAMPCDGLSLEQMCQAVDVIGLSPCVLSLTDPDQSRAYFYSATKSGFAPVIVSQLVGEEIYHAVTVVGFKLADVRTGEVPQDLSTGLTHIYIHDDRLGPYVEVKLRTEHGKLVYLVPKTEPRKFEHWAPISLLMPVHAKIRLAVSALENFAYQIARGLANYSSSQSFVFEHWIELGLRYVGGLTQRGKCDRQAIGDMLARIALPRYVGVIRLADGELGEIEILLDTTSTSSSPHFVGVVLLREDTYSSEAVTLLSNGLDCRSFDLTRWAEDEEPPQVSA